MIATETSSWAGDSGHPPMGCGEAEGRPAATKPAQAMLAAHTITMPSGVAVCAPPSPTSGEAAAASRNCAAPRAAEAVPDARGAAACASAVVLP